MRTYVVELAIGLPDQVTGDVEIAQYLSKVFEGSEEVIELFEVQKIEPAHVIGQSEWENR